MGLEDAAERLEAAALSGALRGERLEVDEWAEEEEEVLICIKIVLIYIE